MTDHDLRKMNRKELLELLIASEEKNEQLKERLHQQAVQLHNRDIQIKDAGSLAEAALAINDVFESADRAAEQYLENIKCCLEQQEYIYDRIVSEAEQKAKEILDKAENERQQKMRAANEYLHGVEAGIAAFYKAHPELREYLTTQSRQKMGDNK